MSDPIVLGYDGSALGERGARGDDRIANETGSAVVVVFAYYISPLGGGDVRDYKEALEKVADHETARAARRPRGGGRLRVGAARLRQARRKRSSRSPRRRARG